MEKGQGALEYLLLIGAAVGIAAVVMVVLFTTINNQQVETAKKEIRLMCAQQTSQTECTGLSPTKKAGNATVSASCAWDSTTNTCDVDSTTYTVS